MGKVFKTITLRLSADEYSHLKQQTEMTGLKMEPLLRQLIMGVNLRPRPPDSYSALLRELSAIGNNINQLAHQANARDENHVIYFLQKGKEKLFILSLLSNPFHL